MAVREETKKMERNNGYSNFKVELWKYQGEMGALIPLLQSAQETYGYIPESAIDPTLYKLAATVPQIAGRDLDKQTSFAFE